MMNSEDRIKYTAKAEVKHVMNVAETSNFGQECYEKMVFEHESGHDRQME